MSDHGTRKDAKPKLGEILLEYGVITKEMLDAALKRQSQVGGQIGSILIELGYITTDILLDFLSRQLGVPAINLCKINISPDILKILPFEKIKEYKILPIETGDRLTIAMVNPNDYLAINDIEFMLGKRVHTVIVPSSQMEAAIKSLEKGGIKEIKGSTIEKSHVYISDELSCDINCLLKHISERKAIDAQLTAGVPPSIKTSSELQRLNMPPLTPADMENYAKALMNEEQYKRFEALKTIEFSFTNDLYGRFRTSIYRQRGSISITLRYIPDRIPGLKELGLPEDLENHALKHQGLMLITGAAGHGKSTTMASLVDIINTKRKCNIITLEDPIEYLHKHKSSNINQREIGTDTASFHEGLKYIFRQDPDVIVIGEMRDPESFRIALQAAETGHLVLSTLHSRNATSAIERVIDIFPYQQQPLIRNQLADALILVLSQRLVAKKDRTGVALAYEKLLNSYKIRNFIRDGKTHQIRSQMQLPGEEYISIDVSLAKLYRDGIITAEEGAKHADNISFYQELIKTKATR